MKSHSLLEGSITKQLIHLALPLLLSNLLQQLYNTADSLIVGQFLGTEAFASTGISGSVMNLFILVLNGFCVGTSMLFGQLYGAGSKGKFRQCVFTALAGGAVLTAIFSIGSLTLLTPLLRLMSTPAELMEYCEAYLNIILAGLICTYLYNLFSAILRAMGDTTASLIVLALSVSLNVGLDILFISGFHIDIQGAALATVLAQLLSTVCCFVYLKKKYPEYLCSSKDIGFYPNLLSGIMRFGMITALQQSSLHLGRLLVQSAVNTLGTSAIAAFTAAMRVEYFSAALGDCGSQSISIFIAQNYGAGKNERLEGGYKNGRKLLLSVGLPLSFLMFVFAEFCISIFIKEADPYVIEQGCIYLRTICVFYALCYLGNCYVGFFRGVGKFLIPFAGTTMQLTVRVILSYLLIARLALGGVAAATGIGWICIVSFHTIMYKKTKKQLIMHK